MNLPTISCARTMRDGGIDAMAALDCALVIAMGHAPEAMHREMKLAIGRAMATIMAETINPAIQAFPELAPTDETWRAVARDRAKARAAAGAPAA